MCQLLVLSKQKVLKSSIYPNRTIHSQSNWPPPLGHLITRLFRITLKVPNWFILQFNWHWILFSLVDEQPSQQLETPSTSCEAYVSLPATPSVTQVQNNTFNRFLLIYNIIFFICYFKYVFITLFHEFECFYIFIKLQFCILSLKQASLVCLI